MATDFFQQQDLARRATVRLVVLFAVAVLATVATVAAGTVVFVAFISRDPDTDAMDWTVAADPWLLVLVLVGTLVVVAGGSLARIVELREGGGRMVAEELGGLLLSPDTSEAGERRLLNVVEEMAIASGTSTPPVYLMDGEAGINAFAAGFAPEDAVIGVTRGAATVLERDELQGVIAHEFSHILNGDMRLNMRLMGLLHGMFLIGMIGYVLLRTRVTTFVVVGGGLSVVGFSGTVFGNLIKAAVGRQREFLADASAVQFTRAPEGIAGALKKIGGLAEGSSIKSPNAPQASHMYFGRGTSGLSAMFSTHPPLEKRILRLDPAWDGEFLELPAEVVEALTVATTASGAEAETGAATGLEVAEAIDRVGRPTLAHLEYAAGLIAQLPESVVEAAHETYGSRALIYALLLDRAPGPRELQLSYLAASADYGVYEETVRLAPAVDQLDSRVRLPLVEMALPALRALTTWQYQRFQESLVELVQADDRLDLFEWALQRILLKDMEACFGSTGPARARHHSISGVHSPLRSLMSVLAYVGDRNPEAAEHAFEQAWRILRLPATRLMAHDECSFADLDAALAELDLISPKLKRRVLEAAVACIAADRRVTSGEAELLRAVSALMSCPMPPILTGNATPPEST